MRRSRDRRSWGSGAGIALLLLALGVGPAYGQHGGGHGGSGSMHGGAPIGHASPHMHHHPGLGGGTTGFGGSPFIFGLGGVFLPVVYTPIYVPPPIPLRGGLMLPNPAVPPAGALPVARTVSRAEPARSDNYVNIGDNLFRAGNRHRAEQRYTQAARANPSSAKPHIRLAQLALVRGDYAEAAEEFRAATTAEPGWLINATDVQALFGEPGDFAKALAKLETHLQAAPTDRDGWLVLGAEWFLSGRTRQAADVFTRLNDRKPDATLASFLDATTPDAIARAPR
jgi:tetratricopeptide (TPR) repeat protein